MEHVSNVVECLLVEKVMIGVTQYVSFVGGTLGRMEKKKSYFKH